MEDRVVPLGTTAVREPAVRLLLADDDARTRALLASWAREAVGDVAVLEAQDGAEAVQLGLQRRPEIALLDVNMPRLGGIEAALTLRELQPRTRLALQTADPLAHRERARDERLPLFGKLELDRAVAWCRAQVAWLTEAKPEPEGASRLSFVCGACGYGIVRAVPPDRCPMCRAARTWSLAAALDGAAVA